MNIFHNEPKYPNLRVIYEYSSFVLLISAGVFEEIEVFYDEPKYPNLRVSYEYSSFRLAPRCYCNPGEYILIDDLDAKTVRAHKFMNNHSLPDLGCANGGRFEANTR